MNTYIVVPLLNLTNTYMGDGYQPGTMYASTEDMICEVKADSAKEAAERAYVFANKMLPIDGKMYPWNIRSFSVGDVLQMVEVLPESVGLSYWYCKVAGFEDITNVFDPQDSRKAGGMESLVQARCAAYICAANCCDEFAVGKTRGDSGKIIPICSKHVQAFGLTLVDGLYV